MSITIGTVTISNNPEHESRVDYRKQSQITNEFEDGTFETFSSGNTMIEVTLFINYVSETEFNSFIAWLTNTVNFSRFGFTVTPPSHFDIGQGKGVAVSDCTYIGPPNTKSIFKPVGRLGRQNLEFRFAYPKPIEASTVDDLGVITT
mgnify:CR=1 FL=1